MESFDEDQRKYIKVEVYHINLKRSAFIRKKTSETICGDVTYV